MSAELVGAAREPSSRARRSAMAALVPVAVVVIGTVGYRLIEGWGWFDSLYMTAITVTTVGYGETHPLDHAGRLFTIFLSLGGVFAVFYSATTVIGVIVTGQLGNLLGRQRMEHNLAAMRDHLVICGYGRMGRLVCREFSLSRRPYVVIEAEAERLAGFDLPHGIALHGDATADEVLRRAGVERARGLIAVLASDADNLYITMSARSLNDRLYIVARADEEGASAKLLRGGANRVVSPYVIGGHRVAQAVLRPAVLDFIELATRTGHLELQMEETLIAAGSAVAGRTLGELPSREELGIVIVGIRRTSGKMLFNPPTDTRLEAGDTVVSLGPRRMLDEFERMARG